MTENRQGGKKSRVAGVSPLFSKGENISGGLRRRQAAFLGEKKQNERNA